MWFKNRRAKYRKTQRCSSPPTQQQQQQRENNPIISPPPAPPAAPLISSSSSNQNNTAIAKHLLNRGASVDETLLLRSKLDHPMLTTSQYNSNRPTTPGSEYTKSIWNPFVLRKAGSSAGLIGLGAGEKRHLMSNLHPSSGTTPSTPSLDLFRKYQQIGAGTTFPPYPYNTSPPPPPPSSDLATKWHHHHQHPLALNTPSVHDQHHLSSSRMFIS